MRNLVLHHQHYVSLLGHLVGGWCVRDSGGGASDSDDNGIGSSSFLCVSAAEFVGITLILVALFGTAYSYGRFVAIKRAEAPSASIGVALEEPALKNGATKELHPPRRAADIRGDGLRYFHPALFPGQQGKQQGDIEDLASSGEVQQQQEVSDIDCPSGVGDIELVMDV